MTPACRGKDAICSGLDAIAWLYENTSANVIVAPVPADLKHAQRIPRAAGLEYVGNLNGVKLYTMNRQRFKELCEAA